MLGSDDRRTKLVWTIVAAGAAVLAANVSRTLLRSGWRLYRDEDPPRNPAAPEVDWPDAIAWSVGSGAVVGLTRLIARRLAATSWQRTTGGLPPM